MTKSLKCPACGQNTWLNTFAGEEFRLVRCLGCGLVRTKMRGKISAPSKKIYADRGEAKKQFRKEGGKFRRYARDTLDLIPKTHGKLLDVGCGLGWVVAEAANRGLDAVGIDEAKVFIEEGRKLLKVSLYPTSLEHYTTREQFDVIVLKHVLEHIKYPRIFLRKVKKLLRFKGLILVATPNIASLMYQLFRHHWYGLQPAQHIWQFTPQSLARLLKVNGFKIERAVVNNLDYQVPGIKGLIFWGLLKLADLTKSGDQVVILAK